LYPKDVAKLPEARALRPSAVVPTPTAAASLPTATDKMPEFAKSPTAVEELSLADAKQSTVAIVDGLPE
jgi:hypothetical protein